MYTIEIHVYEKYNDTHREVYNKWMKIIINKTAFLHSAHSIYDKTYC